MHPRYLRWKTDLTGITDPLSFFGKRTGKRIKKSIAALTASSYHFDVIPMSEHLLDLFVPLYETNIQTKRNGTVFPVKVTILEKMKRGVAYECLALYQHTTFLGGMIYRIADTGYCVAYKVFPKELSVNIQTGVSLIAEYILYTNALKAGKTEIIHGRDRNPYGVFSDIGLAMYKLHIGSEPFISETKENEFFSEESLDIQNDTLVFLGNAPGSKVTEAILYTDKDDTAVHADYHILFDRPFLKISFQCLKKIPT